ncbi:retrovirus-related pol polyprotein from transposon TNT 1-94 [Tanacetum coccineum]
MQNWGSNVSTALSSSGVNFRFGNDQIAKIMGYGDYQLGNVTISRVYYIEGLGHNLFSVGQFCDSDLEVAFRKHTCYVRILDASKTKSWLWHRWLSHLNFSTLNQLAKQGLVRVLPKLKFEKDHLCSACSLGKSKKASHKPKAVDTNQEKLYLLHMDLCGPMQVESINGKKYILVIVDDYSQFTWEKFLRSKDEASKTLRDCYENIKITHETLVACTLQQNGVVKRRKRTLVEATHTMLIFSKAPLFLWAEEVSTACYTQNHSLIRKLKAKADIGIFVGYALAKNAFQIYNKRTRQIMETIHVTFDEQITMASE